MLKHFPDAKISYEKRDKLMPKRGTLSIEKAKKLLNFNPTFSIDDVFIKIYSVVQRIHKQQKLKIAIFFNSQRGLKVLKF